MERVITFIRIQIQFHIVLCYSYIWYDFYNTVFKNQT
jgi:hypothetical protein